MKGRYCRICQAGRDDPKFSLELCRVSSISHGKLWVCEKCMNDPDRDHKLNVIFEVINKL